MSFQTQTARLLFVTITVPSCFILTYITVDPCLIIKQLLDYDNVTTKESPKLLLLYLEPFDNLTRDQFKQFYDTYIKLAEVIVSKLIPADYPKLKEDCLQDIWVACSECFERILSISEAERSKYVSAIMRNVAIDSFNKNVAQPSSFNTMSEEIIDFIEDRSESLSFLKNIEQMDLNHAMTKLPANMRKALEDYYLYDYSVEEISLNEQVSTHAIYKRIERGLKELRLILEEEGGYFE